MEGWGQWLVWRAAGWHPGLLTNPNKKAVGVKSYGLNKELSISISNYFYQLIYNFFNFSRRQFSSALSNNSRVSCK